MADSASLQQDLSRAALGDRAAFERVYRATSAHLFGVALRILNRRDLAEDALQEAFVNVWHNAGSYQAAASQPMTWLIAIVRNKALDYLRAAQRHAADSLDEVDEDGSTIEVADERPNPMQLLMQATDGLRIRGCMEKLDASHRQSLALAYYHGLSHSEVAEQMRAPLGSVKAWVRRGLERLKKCLEAAG
ncbi:MAG TPA: sigma-70 family RNA polymerase sigma factor [Burkholderiaceae bacterium]|nr:sigma-70 family RNA polymerase sigma factor [Burkholderiaceae bacterium]